MSILNQTIYYMIKVKLITPCPQHYIRTTNTNQVIMNKNNKDIASIFLMFANLK